MAGKGDPAKVIRAALLANLGIAVAKFVAAFFSGSATMLAEGVHSVADSTNQALLFFALKQSKKRDAEHPFGHGGELYFWSFVVALMLFFMGGVFAIYEGLHKLRHPEPPGSPWLSILVLSVSLVLEGGSFVVAFKEFNKTRGKKGLLQAIFASKDPIIPVVLLEDAGAFFGLLLALVAVVSASVTGTGMIDGVGSIAIGVLLCAIGLLLARDTKSLLIGEGITEEMRLQTLEIAGKVQGVDEVRQLMSLHVGPETILLALKVKFEASLDLRGVEETTDRLEEAIRAAIPQMKRIFVEPDSDYDAALDKGEA
jgi:cation diffusion facilitator family transporter